MQWDNVNIVKLIDKYRAREVLWNPGKKNYYNKNIKQDAWEELSID